MSEARPAFANLENASGEGTVIREVFLGDSPDNKRGLLGFGFRDSSGNATMPQLTADGRLPITSAAAGNPLKARGEDANGSSSGNFSTIAQIVLQPGLTYTNIFGKVSCRRAAYFQLLTVIDSVEDILEDSIVDSGQYTDDLGNNPLELSVPSGAASAVLQVRGYNFASAGAGLSALRASLNCVEVVS